jgi:cytochrome c oxidase subunit 3
MNEAVISDEAELETATLGMWIFLATEVLLFGGIFTSYAAMRVTYPAAFAETSAQLYVGLGTLNTALLLTSSFTMAMAVLFGRRGKPRVTTALLVTTAVLGMAFLGVKATEWYLELQEQMLPIAPMDFDGSSQPGAQIFMRLYLVGTGLHALHVLGGATTVTVAAISLGRRGWRNGHEMVGLYWHLVDLVWIFLFPLLYLVR